MTTLLQNSWKGTDERVKNTVIQKVYTSFNTILTITNSILTDDSVPQSSEGDNILDLDITPKKLGNLLRIYGMLVTGSSVNMQRTLALFRDNETSALYATGAYEITGATCLLPFEFIMEVDSLEQQNFSVRVGTNGSGSLVINGYNTGNQIYNGTCVSELCIEEISYE